jgi:hypothetical protein
MSEGLSIQLKMCIHWRFAVHPVTITASTAINTTIRRLGWGSSIGFVILFINNNYYNGQHHQWRLPLNRAICELASTYVKPFGLRLDDSLGNQIGDELDDNLQYHQLTTIPKAFGVSILPSFSQLKSHRFSLLISCRSSQSKLLYLLVISHHQISYFKFLLSLLILLGLLFALLRPAFMYCVPINIVWLLILCCMSIAKKL